VNEVRGALAELESADVPYSYRRPPPEDEMRLGLEVDIAMRAADVERAEPMLRSAGFHRLPTPGHRGHIFFVAARNGQWLKLDIKLDARGRSRPLLWTFRRGSQARNMGFRVRVIRVIRALAKRRPVALRRLGPVVAVIGPDGAGKGTLISTLVDEVPIGVTVAYLGTGKPRRADGDRGQGSLKRGSDDNAEVTSLFTLRELAFLVWKAVHWWARLMPAYAAAWRGHLVLCDRHPLEMLAIKPERTPAGNLLERALVRAVPWPDAVVILDAPAELLYRRKGEHSVETLEAWRRSYRDTLVPKGARVVSTTGDPNKAAAQLSAVVWEALRKRRGW
jgi:thymidylate kinase